MTLLELLVKELPGRGGWPDGVEKIGQDYDCELKFLGAKMSRYRSGIYTEQLCAGHRAKGSAGYGETVTREQYEAAIASQQPAWNGEGLPPVGVKCEWQDYNTKKWTPVRVVYSSEWVTIISEDKDDDAIELAIENYGDKGRRKFRQILTEAERKRDAAGLAIYNAINWNAEGEMVSTSRMEDYRKAYDAIAAGKIPGVELSK